MLKYWETNGIFEEEQHGADITESTLRKTLQNLGIKKEIRDLSYVEKRLLIVISLTQQLRNAQGDLSRTIESTANQLKIMQQQISRLKIALGDFLNIFASKLLPYINGFLMALVEIINYINKLVKTALGIKDLEFDYSNLAGTGDNEYIDDLVDGLEEANEEAEKLKKNLIGIDELNILQPEEDEQNDLGIDPALLNAFNLAMEEWNNHMDEADMKANKIRDTILSWFGLEPKDDGTWGLKEGVSLASKLKDIIENIDFTALIDNLSQVLKILGTATLLWLAWKIITNPFILMATGLYELYKGITREVKTAYDWFQKWKDIFYGLALIVAGIAILFKSWELGAIALALLGIGLMLDGYSDYIKDATWNWKDMRKVLAGIGLVLLGFAIITKSWILLAMAGIALIGALALTQLEGFGERFRKGTTSILDWLALIFMALLHSIVFLIENTIRTLLTIVALPIMAFLDLVAVVGIVIIGIFETIWNIIKFIVNGVLKLWNAVTGSNVKLLDYSFDTTKRGIQETIQANKTVFGGIWSNSISGSIDKAVKDAINSKKASNVAPTNETTPNAGYNISDIQNMLNGGTSTQITTSGSSLDDISGNVSAILSAMNTIVSTTNSINSKDFSVNIDSRDIARANSTGSQKLGVSQLGGVFANV